jgi:hypothetical protein
MTDNKIASRDRQVQAVQERRVFRQRRFSVRTGVGAAAVGSWMLKGKMEFRLGSEQRAVAPPLPRQCRRQSEFPAG